MEKDLNPSPAPSQTQARDVFFDNLSNNRLLNYSEAARYLSMSESYLRRLKAQGKISFVAIGTRGVRFRVASLDRWTEKMEMT